MKPWLFAVLWMLVSCALIAVTVAVFCIVCPLLIEADPSGLLFAGVVLSILAAINGLGWWRDCRHSRAAIRRVMEG